MGDGADAAPCTTANASCTEWLSLGQGQDRVLLSRGQAYVAYLTQRYGATHKLLPVPLCGHSARCMFTFDAALPILFPKN